MIKFWQRVVKTQHSALLLVLVVLAALTAACGDSSGSDDPLVRVVAELFPVADEGLMAHRGGADTELVQTALSMETPNAWGITRAPSTRLYAAAAATEIDGFETSRIAATEWTVLERSGLGPVGIPVVAGNDDRTVVAGSAALQEFLASTPSGLPSQAVTAIEAADGVLVIPAAELGTPDRVVDGAELSPVRWVLATRDGEGGGRLVVVFEDDPEQSDAVAVSTRSATAGPLNADGESVLRLTNPLAEGSVVVGDIEWLDPDVFDGGLSNGVFDFLG